MNSVIPDINIPVVQKILNKYFRPLLERIYLRSYFEYVKPGDLDPSKGKILIYAVIGSAYNTYTEVLLYHLLRMKGFDVEYVICNGALPKCEILTKTVLSRKTKEQACQDCSSKAYNILKSAGVSFQLVKKEPEVDQFDIDKLSIEEVLAFHVDGVDIGSIVLSVLYRYYNSLSIDKSDKGLQVAKEYLKAALMNYYYVKHKLDRDKYQYVFFSHGIYSTWQPVVELCKQKGVDFICYDRAKKLGSANFNVNGPSPVWDFSTAWERYKDIELSAEELKIVNDHLQERELQKNDVYKYNNAAKIENLELLKQQLGIPSGATVITFYTNLIWDAASAIKDIAFESNLSCIVKTIQQYKKSKKVHFLVRIHPAEKIAEKLYGVKSQSYSELVRSSFQEGLPSNVTIIEPDMNINSFSVVDISNIGVVHTSTVGLEMAVCGKSVLLISETHYRGKGFTYDIESEDEYFKTLDRLIENPLATLPDQVTLAKKYFYIMMFHYQYDMPLKLWRGLFNGYKGKTIKDLSKEEPIVKIVQRLKEHDKVQDFVFWKE